MAFSRNTTSSNRLSFADLLRKTRDAGQGAPDGCRGAASDASGGQGGTWRIASRMCSRMRDTRGESIVEVLVAVLIGGLAVLMLAVAISSALNIVRSGDKAMEEYYDFTNGFAEGAAASTDGQVAIADGTDTITADVSCIVWSDDDGNAKAVSYTAKD